MNALDLLRNQHREVESLFEKLKEESDGKAKKQMVSELAALIRGHSSIEEKLFYPTSQKTLTGDEEGQNKVLEFFEEHALVTTALETLVKTPVNDKRWMARCKVLEELFHNHTQEEEQDLFPRMEDEMGAEELEKLGAQLERRFRTAVSRAAPKGRAATKRTATKRGAAKRATGRAASTKRAATKRATPAKRATTTKRAGAKRATTKRAPASTRSARAGTTTKRRASSKTGAKRTTRGRSSSGR